MNSFARILVLLALLAFGVAPANAAPTALRVLGDSISTTYGASAPAQAWPNKLGTFFGVPLGNYAVSGSMALDQAIVSRSVAAPAVTDFVTLMIGVNDCGRYFTAAQREHYRRAEREIIVWQNMPQRTSARSPNVTYTGNWQDAQPAWSTGRLVIAVGSTATTTFLGKSVYIGTILQDLSITNTSSFNVFVDNVLVGTMSSGGAGIGTQLGNVYGPASYMFTGYADTAGQQHTVKLVLTAGYAYLEYIAGSDQPLGAPFYLSNATPTFQPSDPCTPANKAALNVINADLVTEFQAAGRNVFALDSFNAITEADLMPDKIHVPDGGHNKLFIVRRDAMSGPPPVQTYRDATVKIRNSDNVVFACDVAAVCYPLN